MLQACDSDVLIEIELKGVHHIIDLARTIANPSHAKRGIQELGNPSSFIVGECMMA